MLQHRNRLILFLILNKSRKNFLYSATRTQYGSDHETIEMFFSTKSTLKRHLLCLLFRSTIWIRNSVEINRELAKNHQKSYFYQRIWGYRQIYEKSIGTCFKNYKNTIAYCKTQHLSQAVIDRRLHRTFNIIH